MKRIKKRSGILVFVGLSLLILTNSTIAVSSLIASDKKEDLYEFDKDYIDDLIEDIFDNEDVREIEHDDYIDMTNEFYDEIVDNIEKSEQVKKPKYLDIISIHFELDNESLIFKMNSDIELNDNEMITGFIWSKEHSYTFILLEKNSFSIETGMDETTNIEIKDGTFTLYNISSDFNDEKYVKCVLIYSDFDSNDYIIEMFNNSIKSMLIFDFVLFVVILIVIVLIIYIIKKLRE